MARVVMGCNQSQIIAIEKSAFGIIDFAYRIVFFVVLVGLFAGCQQLPGGQAMRQYQLESDRLVNEFRAQKKRAEELEARNMQLEKRLAESEKLIAKSQLGLGRRNARSTNNDPEWMIGDLDDSRYNNGLSESGSSRSIANRNASGRVKSGLPDAVPSASGQFTSTGTRDPASLGYAPRDLRGDKSSPSQWRPITNPSR